VARLYEATRPGYPAELAEFVAATAGIGPGSPVLEVGWAIRPADATAFSGSGLFAASVRRTFTRRATYSAEGVMGVENTRATSLSWPQDARDGFNAELRQLLGGREVPLTLEAPVTMARVRG